MGTASPHVRIVSIGVFSLAVHLVTGDGVFPRFPPLRSVWLLLPFLLPLVTSGVINSRPTVSALAAGPGSMVRMATVTPLFEFCRWPVRLLRF